MTSGTHFTSKDNDGNEISFNYPDGWAIQERTAGSSNSRRKKWH